MRHVPLCARNEMTTHLNAVRRRKMFVQALSLTPKSNKAVSIVVAFCMKHMPAPPLPLEDELAFLKVTTEQSLTRHSR